MVMLMIRNHQSLVLYRRRTLRAQTAPPRAAWTIENPEL